jgi:hypothetical protein
MLSGDYPGNAPKKRRTMTVEQLEPEEVTPSPVEANGDGFAANPASTDRRAGGSRARTRARCSMTAAAASAHAIAGESPPR